MNAPTYLGDSAPAGTPTTPSAPESSDALTEDDLRRLGEEFELRKMRGGDLLADAPIEEEEQEEEKQQTAQTTAVEPVESNSAKTLMQGYLFVKEHGVLRRQWVALQGHSLMIYESAACERRKSTYDSGMVDLRFVTGVASTDATPGAFVVRTDEEAYTLVAASAEERGRWMARICAVMAQLEDARRLIAAGAASAEERYRAQFDYREGALRLCPNPRAARPRWDVMHVVMKGGHIFVYRADARRRLVVKRALYHCRLQEFDPDAVPWAFEIITDTDDGRSERILLRADDEATMHLWLNTLVRQKVALEDFIDNIGAGHS